MAMTRLEAINLMLAAVSEAPVTSEFSAQSIEDGRATNMLNDCQRQIVAMGWDFNTIKRARVAGIGDYRLINVPTLFDQAAPIQIQSLDPNVDAQLHFSQNGTYVVDGETNKGGTLPETMYVRAIMSRTWDELPEAAREAIAQLAKIRYANDTITSTEQAKLLDPGFAAALEILRSQFTPDPIIYESYSIPPDWRVEALNVINTQRKATGEGEMPAQAPELRKMLRMLSESLSWTLTRGWSFNTVLRATLALMANGRQPAAVLSAEGTRPTLWVRCVDPTIRLVQTGKFIVNADTGGAPSDRFPVRAIVEVPYEDMPTAARVFVTRMAEARYTSGRNNEEVTTDPLLALALQDLKAAFTAEKTPYESLSVPPDWRVDALNLLFEEVEQVQGQPAQPERHEDIDKALRLLSESLKWTLNKGWSFNTVLRALLVAFVDGIQPAKVFVSGNLRQTLWVKCVDPTIRIVQRGDFIVNADTGGVPRPQLPVRAVIEMPYSDIPVAARVFITRMAAARYRTGKDGEDASGDPMLASALQDLRDAYTAERSPYESLSFPADWRVEALNLMFSETRPVQGQPQPPEKPEDVDKALRLLSDSYDWMLSLGWTFNTLRKASLEPDENGYVYSTIYVDGIPVQTMRVQSLDPDREVVQVGNRIVDRDSGSSAFFEVPLVRATVRRAWSEVPEAAQQYVALMAKSRYANDGIITGSQASMLDSNAKMALQVLTRDYSVEPIVYPSVNMIPSWRLDSPNRRYPF